MKFGCCTSLWEDTILQVAGVGADYAEVGFSGCLPGRTLEQIRDRGAQLEETGIRVEAMNGFFPGDLRLTGPEADPSAVDRYLEENLPKAAALGVEVVVFGSGGARRVPNGFPKEEAFAQLVELGREHIGPALGAYGITCCLEPLNPLECNIFTTTEESFELVRQVDHPNFQLLVDLYHFDMSQEQLSQIPGYRGHLCHTHIASAKNARQIPMPGDGEDYGSFFQALKDIGYQGRMSLEGNISQGVPQIGTSLAYLKDLARQAGL
ncbi:MAG: sugar phosphate isomerase/epimerase family protein [Acutalibacter sp.]|jgi:D-psicose/D-tagatose/L-ribulose 3-epimerase